MNDQPGVSVSVVLCTYNGSRFIEEQVKTILSQTFPITELIISDDASADTTPEILQQLAMQDSRIRLVMQEKNLGFSNNFQQAMRMATSTLIAPPIRMISGIRKRLKEWWLHLHLMLRSCIVIL